MIDGFIDRFILNSFRNIESITTTTTTTKCVLLKSTGMVWNDTYWFEAKFSVNLQWKIEGMGEKKKMLLAGVDHRCDNVTWKKYILIRRIFKSCVTHISSIELIIAVEYGVVRELNKKCHFEQTTQWHSV